MIVGCPQCSQTTSNYLDRLRSGPTFQIVWHLVHVSLIGTRREAGGSRPLTCTCWSGCRDSNPGPSVPQTDALTKLRHSPLLLSGRVYAGRLTRLRPSAEEPLDALVEAEAQVHDHREGEELEVPRDRRELLVVFVRFRGRRADGPRVDDPAAGRAGAVGAHRRRGEEPVALRAPRHDALLD